MPRTLIIQHAAPETLGSSFTGLLTGLGFKLDTVNFFAQSPEYAHFPAPDLAAVNLVIALGGPLSANDDYPALLTELDYLKNAVRRGIPVFGVCLGAQLLAKALGGQIKPTGGFQFGLRRISITPAGHADPVFGRLAVPLVPTLHGDCFSIPEGAVKLAEGFMLRRDGSFLRINMAFRCGNCYGFQFEPQLTLAALPVWNRELFDAYRLMGNLFDPQEESERFLGEFTRYSPLYEAQMENLLRAFLAETGLAPDAAAAPLPRPAPLP